MAPARNIVQAALTLALVACAASAEDQSRTIAVALCEQKASCGENVSNVNACADTLETQIVAVCSDDDARACSSALLTCGASLSNAQECAPCR